MYYKNLNLSPGISLLCKILTLLFICGFSSSPAGASEAPASSDPITPEAAAQAVNAEVLMEGVVTELVKTEGGTIYLNFGEKFPKETLTVVILPSLLERFPGLEKFPGQKVRVKGKVTLKDGKHPRIIVREPGDLLLVSQP